MFIVIELQTNANNQTSAIVTPYEDKAVAENKYHTILAFAATSEVPIHAAVMLDERGNLEKNEFYRHEIPQVVEEGE